MRSQSSLEYILIYSFALIVIITVGITLYKLGIFTPATPKAYQGSAEFTIIDFKLAGNNLTLVLAPSFDAELHSINVTGSATGIWTGKMRLAQGQEHEFQIPLNKNVTPGAKYKMHLYITYSNPITNLNHTYSAVLQGTAEGHAYSNKTTSWYYNYLSFRRPINISENSGNNLSDFQVAINLTYDSDMQPDFSDIRFTYFNDTSESEIPIHYYVESKVDGAWAYVWLKVPFIPASSLAKVYVYYGNSSLSSESNASQVFDFYDGFETWSGWVQYSSGVVSQSSDRAYRGIYSLKKDSFGDPNGGYKDLGFTLNYPFVLEAWVYRSYLSGANADRLGVIDASGNGYGPIFNHGSPYLGIDKRTGYSASVYGRNYTSNALNYQWYFMQFTWNAGNMTAKAYDNSGNLVVSASTVDTSYSSFTRVYVFGGYTYYVDELRIRKYIFPDPTYTIGSEESI